MALFYNEQIRNERDCGLLEFWLRRTYSSIFYHRIYRRKYPGSPYYVPYAVNFLSKLLYNKKPKVFEWGSGISTVWYAQKVDSLITIEHNEEWYHKVTKWLKNNKLNNVELRYIPPINNSFESYSQAISEYEDEFFDIVVVDGRNRVRCTVLAMNKVKKGGYLILDDSHRARYQSVFDLLVNYECKRYDFGLLQTTIFRRLK